MAALDAPRSAVAAELRGLVVSGVPPIVKPLAEYTVTLYGTDPKPKRCAKRLGRATTDESGLFSITFQQPVDASVVLYVVAENDAAAPRKCAKPGRGDIALASVLGTVNTPVPTNIVVNERTTVASAYSLAQFLDRSDLRGKSPGLQNAAMMVQNLVDLETGEIAGVLAKSPNGGDTTSLITFNSLANMLAACIHATDACATFLALTAPPRGRAPSDTLQALVDIVHNPWQNVADLAALALEQPAPFQPSLPPGSPPDAWTLALRFDGDGKTMSGPGNIAFDASGSAWVTNNYVFSMNPLEVCGSDLLLRFSPTGQYVIGSPYAGGGLAGAGYGITLDPAGNVWVGNFGFNGLLCAEPIAGVSVSKFSPDGIALSPSTGFMNGPIVGPQGTVSDRDGNIWIASCGNDTVVRYPRGDQTAPQVFASEQLKKPFDIAFNRKGWAFITGNESNNVIVLKPDGTPIRRSPIDDGLFDRPMGIAADSKGNMWVANSTGVNPPCYDPTFVEFDSFDGSLTLIKKNGKPAKGSPFTGGGMALPWGIAVDGNDNVWVSNFNGQRISHFCGRKPRHCPPGLKTGEPISPDTGYGFDGLTRSTAVEIDSSGNVWAANNWMIDVDLRNPGGLQMVIFLGLAKPIQTPLIGPPRRP